MMSVVGVDGCKGGWLAIRHSESGEIVPQIIKGLEQIRPLPDVLTIDMPIGLPAIGRRDCDGLAKSLLGPKRGLSVFYCPPRDVVFAESDSLAYDLHPELASPHKLQPPANALRPRIRNVDNSLLADDALRSITFEVHPEVSFAAWNGRPIEESKKKADGLAIRKSLVQSFFGVNAFDYVRKSIASSRLDSTGHAHDDDIVDAFAAVWTAWRIVSRSVETLPNPPQTDLLGQRMGIWY